jgi:hypothetical protein
LRHIFYTAFSNAFDIFLASFVVYWSYRWAKRLVHKSRREKYTDITILEQIVSYGVCFFISASIATGIFFLRGGSVRYDAVYSLTGFFMLFIPSIIGTLSVYYTEWYPEKEKR